MVCGQICFVHHKQETTTASLSVPLPSLASPFLSLIFLPSMSHPTTDSRPATHITDTYKYINDTSATEKRYPLRSRSGKKKNSNSQEEPGGGEEEKHSPRAERKAIGRAKRIEEASSSLSLPTSPSDDQATADVMHPPKPIQTKSPPALPIDEEALLHDSSSSTVQQHPYYPASSPSKEKPKRRLSLTTEGNVFQRGMWTCILLIDHMWRSYLTKLETHPVMTKVEEEEQQQTCNR